MRCDVSQLENEPESRNVLLHDDALNELEIKRFGHSDNLTMAESTFTRVDGSPRFRIIVHEIGLRHDTLRRKHWAGHVPSLRYTCAIQYA